MNLHSNTQGNAQNTTYNQASKGKNLMPGQGMSLTMPAMIPAPMAVPVPPMAIPAPPAFVQLVPMMPPVMMPPMMVPAPPMMMPGPPMMMPAPMMMTMPMMMPVQQGQGQQSQGQQGQGQQSQGQQGQGQQSQGYCVVMQPGDDNGRQDPLTVGEQQDPVSPFYASP